jgi:hypothetical protein
MQQKNASRRIFFHRAKLSAQPSLRSPSSLRFGRPRGCSLVPGTLQVYYMKGYGAVEMGVHRFHHPGHEETEGVGEGKFVHLWQYKDGAWKITTAISYDHHAAAK